MMGGGQPPSVADIPLPLFGLQTRYEFAPLFGAVWGQIDQNLMAMQICEEVAAKHGLAALFQEKPFDGINGSGKHNNWSISTNEGAQLLNPEDLAEKTGNTELFPLVMACIVAAIDKYGDMMRLSIACPGNDFRLGAMEAPPSIISTYLGEQLTGYLDVRCLCSCSCSCLCSFSISISTEFPTLGCHCWFSHLLA
jgi:glutamine synthetase type III